VIAAFVLASLLSASEPHGAADGRAPLRHITPAVVRLAQSFLTLPMGAEREAEVEGRRCLFVVERHFHPPGFTRGPQGWHKGVTVYELP
jgi:hypothetical protein